MRLGLLQAQMRVAMATQYADQSRQIVIYRNAGSVHSTAQATAATTPRIPPALAAWLHAEVSAAFPKTLETVMVHDQ